MEDVAKAAGVSTATVSRVLNSPSLVAEATLTRVHRAIERLGYQPNVFAQGLTTRRSQLLGILLPDIHGEFYSELLRGADAEARSRGYHLLVSTQGTEQKTPTFSPSLLGFISGLAVMITEPNDRLWAQVQRDGLPLVVIDESREGNAVDRVLVDNRSGTRDAVEHLLESVAPEQCYFVGGPKENFDTAERSRVFIETLARHRCKASTAQVRFGEYSVESGQRACEQIFARPPAGPVGIFAANDEIAFGILLAAKDMAIGVPSDLRIVGFDDTRLASLIRPQLTTVRVPMADVGAAAVRMLVERQHDPMRPATAVTLPTRLVIRGTSRPH